MEREPMYRIVLKEDGRVLPFRFERFEQAEEFILKMNLNAYITIM